MLTSSRPSTQESVVSQAGVNFTLEVDEVEEVEEVLSASEATDDPAINRRRLNSQKTPQHRSLDENRRGRYNDSFSSDDDHLSAKLRQNLSLDESVETSRLENKDEEKDLPAVKHSLAENVKSKTGSPKNSPSMSTKQEAKHPIPKFKPPLAKAASENKQRGVVKQPSVVSQGGGAASTAAIIQDGTDRKALRDALYQGIFHRHRKTIFAMGSFMRMLRTKTSQYNSIRSSSEGEDS